MTEARKPKVTTTHKVNLIRIKTTKNSLGPDNRTILLPIVYYSEFDERFGRNISKFRVGWHEATVTMLEKPPAEHETALKEVLSVYKVSNTSRYYCKAAGVSKEDALPPDELVPVIMKNESLVADLRAVLQIQTGDVFAPSEDFIMNTAGDLYV